MQKDTPTKEELRVRKKIFHKQNHMLDSNSGTFILLETINHLLVVLERKGICSVLSKHT